MSEGVIVFPNKHWQKFFNKFQEIETLKNSKWKDVHLLAYLCQRYKSFYSRNFSFSFKGAPSKCPEMFLVKQISAMLNTDNPRTIREYIDWVFDDKIIPKNMKIRSLGYFITPGLGNEFYLKRAEKNKIQKTTELPTEYKLVAEELQLPVSTYGDLAFAKNALSEAPEHESRAPYRKLFEQLLALGFENSVLDNLK